MRNIEDHYFKKAKKEGFLARSAYKLEEIQQKHKIVKQGDHVIDLGCYPGSWMQYLSRLVGDKGLVLGVDRTELQLSLSPNMRFVQGDIYELDLNKPGEFATKWDLLVSDMAPNTTGNRVTDSERSFQLCELAVITASKWVKQGGHMVAKSLQGPAFERLLKLMREEYQSVKIQKPKSTRSESKEVFLIGMNKKNPPSATEESNPLKE